MIGIDLPLGNSVDIDVGNAGVLISETNPTGSGTAEAESRTGSGVHCHDRRTATLGRVGVFAPAACIGNGARGLFITSNAGTGRRDGPTGCSAG